MDSIQTRIRKERKKIDLANHNLRLHRERMKKEKKRISELKRDIETCDKAIAVVQSLGSLIQTKTHQIISSIATSCLQAIFKDDSYELKIEISRKRNAQEARMFLIKSGQEFTVPDDCAGGELDIISFALRVAAIVLSGKEKVLIMDEPFRFLSREFRENIGEMLESLCDRLGFQIILITHYRELEIGKVIHLE